MKPAPRTALRGPGLGLGLGLAMAALLGACSSAPPVPDWQLDAHAASTRALSAALDGKERVAALEFARAREQLSRTADPARVARLELLRCAVATASLAQGPCPGFEALRADATDADRAYADWLLGRINAQAMPLLPAAQQAAAALVIGGGAGEAGRAAATVAAIEDPLSRLVAASVLLQAGQGDAALIDVAIDTASAQGWRRALAAWLQAGVRVAGLRGDEARASQLRRRLDLLRPAPDGR